MIVVTPEAQDQARTIDDRWRKERPAAPDLFLEELAAAFALLSSTPLAGRRYRHATVADVRRVLLRSSRYHVYYRPRDEDIVVLAVWSAVRGSGPELR
jgi:plasmid stabilization system protein ParE